MDLSFDFEEFKSRIKVQKIKSFEDPCKKTYAISHYCLFSLLIIFFMQYCIKKTYLFCYNFKSKRLDSIFYNFLYLLI